MGNLSNVCIADEQIKEYFQEFGNVVQVYRPSGPQVYSAARPVCKAAYCFVTFDRESTAEMLIKKGSATVAGQVVEIGRALESKVR